MLKLRHCHLFSIRYDSQRVQVPLSSRKKLRQDHVPHAGTRSAIVWLSILFAITVTLQPRRISIRSYRVSHSNISLDRIWKMMGKKKIFAEESECKMSDKIHEMWIFMVRTRTCNFFFLIRRNMCACVNVEWKSQKSLILPHQSIYTYLRHYVTAWWWVDSPSRTKFFFFPILHILIWQVAHMRDARIATADDFADVSYRFVNFSRLFRRPIFLRACVHRVSAREHEIIHISSV